MSSAPLAHVSVPEDLAGPAPVIIALHGKGDNGGDFLEATGLDQARAIVAAPTGVGLAWAPAPYAHTTLEQDQQRIDAILDHLIAHHDIDSERIYLTGFSNGGGLAVSLSLLDDRYAAVATVSAAVRAHPEDIAKGEPVDYLNIHGTYDDVVPFGGEARSPYSGVEDDPTYGAPEVVSAFERRNQGIARAELRRVEGMGHEWPTGGWAARRGIDVTATVLEFFGVERR